MRASRGLRFSALAAAIAVGAVALPPPAHAWWRGGFGIGIGVVPFVPYAYPYAYPYPYYYPPPVVYAPPAVSYGSPAPTQTQATSPACYAGPYVCPLAHPTPVGAMCSCPTNDNGRAGGRVG